MYICMYVHISLHLPFSGDWYVGSMESHQGTVTPSVIELLLVMVI